MQGYTVRGLTDSERTRPFAYQVSEGISLRRDYRLTQRSKRLSPNRIPVKLFSNTHYGGLMRIGYSAIIRHCNRYGKKLDYALIPDVVQEVISISPSEFLNAMYLGQFTSKQLIMDYSRIVVNTYKRLKRKDSLFQPIAQSRELISEYQEDNYNHYSTSKIGIPDRNIEQVENEQYLREILSIEEYHVSKLLIAGYTDKEIAQKMRKGLRTIRRYKANIRLAITSGAYFMA